MLSERAALTVAVVLLVVAAAAVALLPRVDAPESPAGTHPLSAGGAIDRDGVRADTPGRPAGITPGERRVDAAGTAGLSAGSVPADNADDEVPLTAMGGLIAAVAILAACFLLWRLRRRRAFTAVHRFCRATWPEIPVLGAVPLVPGKQIAAALAGQVPHVGYADSVRAIGSSLQGNEDRVVLLTSAESGEGRTTVALSLAAAFARDGQRVLLIDADLRAPTLSRVLNLPTYAGGLSELVTRAAPYRACLALTAVPNLHVIRSGSLPQDPTSILASARFVRTLQLSRQYYDRIVIDSPAFARARDAEILAAVVDRVVVMVDPRACRFTRISEVIDLLKRVNASIAGIVFNRVLS